MVGDDDYALASHLLDMCKKRKKKGLYQKSCVEKKKDDAAFSYGYLGRIKKYKSPFSISICTNKVSIADTRHLSLCE